MRKNLNFYEIEAGADNSRAMETETIQKNGTSPKSHTSRWNLIKILLFFVILCFGAAGTFAQDIITLKTGDDIQALVQEIGIDDVTYKKFENPNGPNYKLKKSEIFMIRYENASKDVFKDEAPAPSTNQTNAQGMSNNQQAPPIDYNTFLQLRGDDNKMAEFLKTNDRDLYEQFHRGASLRDTGGGLLVTGLFFTVVGGALEVIGFSNTDNETGEITNGGSTTIIVGGVMLTAGQIFIITSIPLSATGGSLKRRAADSYEEKYFSHRTSFNPSLNFGVIGNGVGIALKF
ncbi:MAG: hypothetical protein FWG84_01600 [Bacteroidales bacterium]|nr:hypothetical protein [Bacteroidales bacterium]